MEKLFENCKTEYEIHSTFLKALQSHPEYDDNQRLEFFEKLSDVRDEALRRYAVANQWSMSS
jgi:hypothetical protein